MSPWLWRGLGAPKAAPTGSISQPSGILKLDVVVERGGGIGIAAALSASEAGAS